MNVGRSTSTYALIAIFTFIFSLPIHAATWNLVFPKPHHENDLRNQYPTKLLALALTQTGVNFEIKGSERPLLQRKAIKLLSENREVNILWGMTDIQREETLRAIRIPIYKGLIGWRVLIIPDDSIIQYKRINTLDDLISYTPIQGVDWPDTKILQANGFDVKTSKNYINMFAMLAQGGGDVFPRSVVEVFDELSTQSSVHNVKLLKNIGIRYPTAMYFFVNKNNVVLSNLIETGLNKAIENGEFDGLFEAYYQPILEQANMDERKFFMLNNPLLPKRTPLAKAHLWYAQ